MFGFCDVNNPSQDDTCNPLALKQKQTEPHRGHSPSGPVILWKHSPGNVLPTSALQPSLQ